MEALLRDILGNKLLWKTGELFKIDDHLVEPSLTESLEAVKQIIIDPDYENNINDQNVAEICLTKFISTIKTTRTERKYQPMLVEMLHCCLHYPLQSANTTPTPHAKIASDILSYFFMNRSKIVDLKKFLDTSVKFLLCKNQSIIENLSSFFLLIIDNNINLMAQHIGIVLESVLADANHLLLPLLVPLYRGVENCRALIKANFKQLLTPRLHGKGDASRTALLQLAASVLEDDRKVVEDCLGRLMKFLNYPTSIRDIIHFLNEVFCTNQIVFYYHVTGLMQVGLAAEAEGFDLIGSLLVSICSFDEDLAKQCLIYLTACLFHKTSSTEIIFAWIDVLLWRHRKHCSQVHRMLEHLESKSEVLEFESIVARLRLIVSQRSQHGDEVAESPLLSSSPQPPMVMQDTPRQPPMILGNTPQQPPMITDDTSQQPPMNRDDTPQQPIIMDDTTRQPPPITDDMPPPITDDMPPPLPLLPPPLDSEKKCESNEQFASSEASTPGSLIEMTSSVPVARDFCGHEPCRVQENQSSQKYSSLEENTAVEKKERSSSECGDNVDVTAVSPTSKIDFKNYFLLSKEHRNEETECKDKTDEISLKKEDTNRIVDNTNKKAATISFSRPIYSSYFENNAFSSSVGSLYDDVCDTSVVSIGCNASSSSVNFVDNRKAEKSAASSQETISESKPVTCSSDDISIEIPEKVSRVSDRIFGVRLENLKEDGWMKSDNWKNKKLQSGGGGRSVVETSMDMELLTDTDSKSTLTPDILDCYIEEHKEEIKNFLSTRLLDSKLPLPDDISLSIPPAGNHRQKRKGFLEFRCSSGNPKCTFGHGSAGFKLESNHLQIWLHAMYLAYSVTGRNVSTMFRPDDIDSKRGNAAAAECWGSRDSAASAFCSDSSCTTADQETSMAKKIRWAWSETVDKNFNKTIMSGLPCEKDMLKITKELSKSRYHDLFSSWNGGRICFICKNSDDNKNSTRDDGTESNKNGTSTTSNTTATTTFIKHDGSVNMNGLLSEKSGYFKFLKPWKITQFFIDGFSLSYVRNNQPILLEEITKIKARERNMIVSKYTTVSLTAFRGVPSKNSAAGGAADDAQKKKKKLVLKFFDKSEATTWIRCLHLVMAKVQSVSDSLGFLSHQGSLATPASTTNNAVTTTNSEKAAVSAGDETDSNVDDSVQIETKNETM